MAAPKTPATMRLIIIASAITTPSIVFENQSAAMTPIMMAKAAPLSVPTMVSFQIMRAVFVDDSCFVANARTATVSACVPALPPIDATIGMRTARATICSIVASKNEITTEANIAVSRFTKSHRNRVPVVDNIAR